MVLHPAELAQPLLILGANLQGRNSCIPVINAVQPMLPVHLAQCRACSTARHCADADQIRRTRSRRCSRMRVHLSLVPLHEGEQALVPDDREVTLLLGKSDEVLYHGVDHTVRQGVLLVLRQPKWTHSASGATGPSLVPSGSECRRSTQSVEVTNRGRRSRAQCRKRCRRKNAAGERQATHQQLYTCQQALTREEAHGQAGQAQNKLSSVQRTPGIAANLPHNREGFAGPSETHQEDADEEGGRAAVLHLSEAKERSP